MDPLMRRWLTGLNKQRTELDWQNRNLRLFEDVNQDVEEFKKRYKEIHGIDPTPEQLVDIAGKVKQGKKPADFFPQAKETPTQTPSAPKPEYVPQSGTSDPIGMARAMEQYRETAKRYGVDLSPGLEKQLENIKYTRGPESAEAALQDMIGSLMKEQGTSAPELPAKTPAAAATSTPTPTPSTPSTAKTAPVTPPTTPKTPEESVMSFAKGLAKKAPKGTPAAVTGLFGVAGAKGVYDTIQDITRKSSEPTYGRSEIQASPAYRESGGGMSDEELRARGMVMAAQDITRGAESATLPTIPLTLTPGTGKVPQALRGVGKVGTQAFLPLAAASLGFEALNAADRGEYGEATRRGADATQWGAGMFPALSQYANIGIGKQLTRDAVQTWLNPEAGAFDKAIQTAGAGIGAAMVAKPAIGVGKAFAKGGLKAGGKALLKSTPVGALVAAPFAISRAAEGDWAGAGLEALGAIPGAALVTEPILAVRDARRAQEKREDEERKQKEFVQGRYERFMKTHPELRNTEDGGVAAFMRYGEEELRAQEASERRQRQDPYRFKFIPENTNPFETLMRLGLDDRCASNKLLSEQFVRAPRIRPERIRPERIRPERIRPEPSATEAPTIEPPTEKPTEKPEHWPVEPYKPDVIPDRPPVTPEEPPVTPQEPKQPPVTPKEPPVKPPVTPKEPPVTPKEPPVTPKEPPVTPKEPGTTPETKPETGPETKPETRPETKPQTKPQTKPETKPQVAPQVAPQTAPETKPQTKPETKPTTPTQTPVTTRTPITVNLVTPVPAPAPAPAPFAPVIGGFPVLGPIISPSRNVKPTPGQQGYVPTATATEKEKKEPEKSRGGADSSKPAPMDSGFDDVRWRALRSSVGGVMTVYESVSKPKKAKLGNKKSGGSKYKIVMIGDGGKKTEIKAGSLSGVKRTVFGKSNFKVYNAQGTDISTYFKQSKK